MKKFLAALVTVASAAAFAPAAQAATLAPTFDVVINLTSACEVTTAPSNVIFNYTSFAAAASTSTGGGFDVKCTNTLPYTLALDATTVTDDATNLAYSLTLSNSSATGNGSDQSYTISGTMASGQAGTCATASCTNAAATNKTRTLTVAY